MNIFPTNTHLIIIFVKNLSRQAIDTIYWMFERFLLYFSKLYLIEKPACFSMARRWYSKETE